MILHGVTFRPAWFGRDTLGAQLGFCTDDGVAELRRTFALEGAEISVQSGYVVAFIRPCAFCGYLMTHDTHQEENYPAVPCCADEEQCRARAKRDALEEAARDAL